MYSNDCSPGKIVQIVTCQCNATSVAVQSSDADVDDSSLPFRIIVSSRYISSVVCTCNTLIMLGFVAARMSSLSEQSGEFT